MGPYFLLLPVASSLHESSNNFFKHFYFRHRPSSMPSSTPGGKPSLKPSKEPSSMPSSASSNEPSLKPSSDPLSMPSSTPSYTPSSMPSTMPSSKLSIMLSSKPSTTFTPHIYDSTSESQVLHLGASNVLTFDFTDLVEPATGNVVVTFSHNGDISVDGRYALEVESNTFGGTLSRALMACVAYVDSPGSPALPAERFNNLVGIFSSLQFQMFYAFDPMIFITNTCGNDQIAFFLLQYDIGC
jgi:hypothetical protein